ncbi:hypothetical protein O181_038262 [Austropuccinia psidii MF-1]|uniref:Protein phosphatase 1 regulatory subunit 7 n=1 Tax=Austropuccinia psidii MF-1 TaxID=1389203 RepID=A0A9Q3DAL1_9BASI|nr:hypothetical protein [Austropuccinia psidii MF-1]
MMSSDSINNLPSESASPIPESSTARLDHSSYQEGIEESKRLIEEQAIESSRGELAWSIENQDLINEIKPGTEEIDLSHSRIRTLRGFEQHLVALAPSLKRLNFRQNLINSLQLDQLIDHRSDGSLAKSAQDLSDQKIVPFHPLVHLEELDLYDNQISKIAGLDSLENLKTLDLSFNLIRKIENLDHLKSLKTFYLIQNKISRIEKLDCLCNTLTSLELGSNRIRHITNLSSLTNLTELWLGRNKISKLEGLESLVNLKSLSIQSNRIVKLEGLENLRELEELYISHNGLTKIGDGLLMNKKLKVLDISANQINELNGIEELSCLEELWANNNQLSVAAFNSISPKLSQELMPNLKTVYLEGNPLQTDMGPNYRRKLVLACPQLIQIDATFVKTS